ncbi:MAG: MAPEG family protein [Chakrabartia sp.]
MHSDILHPVVALAAWTMIIWLWMYITRIPAMQKIPGLDLNTMVGGIGADLDKVMPAKTQWIAHNYNHLHEAPTVFYATALVLAIVGAGDGMNATIAWAYVFLRVAHSLVQILWNRILVRFAIFALSSIALIMQVVHAYMAVIAH